MGGKIIPRIRLTSAKFLVEVEAELGNMKMVLLFDTNFLVCKGSVLELIVNCTLAHVVRPSTQY